MTCTDKIGTNFNIIRGMTNTLLDLIYQVNDTAVNVSWELELKISTLTQEIEKMVEELDEMGGELN